MRKLFTSATVAALLGVVSTAAVVVATAPAYAQQNNAQEVQRRQRQTLSESTARVLGEVFNDINSDKTAEALQKLNNLLQRELQPFDLSTALELRGGLYAQQNNYPAALKDFVRILELDTLPFDRLRQIRYNVAQLYFAEENYDQAIRFMREYLAEEGNVEDANAWYILAAAYVSKDDYRNARQPAERVLQYDKKKEKKNFDLLNLIYSELELNVERGRLLEQMVELFPQEESYWAQLSGAYAQAGRDKDAFATLEAAYKAGLIRDEPKIVALAQYYSALDNPYRGAKLIEAEMQGGTVKRNLRNLELLAQLWSMSREQKKAIEALTAAAQLSSTGELYYRLGQSYMADEQFARAVENLQTALQRGGITPRDRGDIYILIGSAYFNIDSDTRAGRQRARAAFQQAAQYDTSRTAARGWIDYIDAIQNTLDAQDAVEAAQRAEERRRAIERCETIIEVSDLSGGAETKQVRDCRTFIAEAAAADAAGTAAAPPAGAESETTPATETPAAAADAGGQG